MSMRNEKIKIIFIGVPIGIMIGLAPIIPIYEKTKQSYKSVGFNDGRIYQRSEIIEILEKSNLIHSCKDKRNGNDIIELISVKSDSLYMIVFNDKKLIFCR